MLPNVSLCAQENEVHYNPLSPTPPTPSYDYVDLGLPSGTLWATKNVGANSITDYGNYYQYGKGADTYQVTSGGSPYNGMDDPLDISVDTARLVWGGSWHMPTRAQMQELIANTTYEWVEDYQGSGINGGKFTAQNGNYVFLPGASDFYNGENPYVGLNASYWTSTPRDNSNAYYMFFKSGYEDANGYSNRVNGFPVRPVLG